MANEFGAAQDDSQSILEPVEATRWTASGNQHRVKVKSNLRQEASMQAPVFALVNAGAIVNVIGEDRDWFHVEIHGSIAKSQIGPSIDPPKK